jgi:hypothetical protein
LCPATTTSPGHAGTSTARPGLGHVVACVSFIHPLVVSYLRSRARSPGHSITPSDAKKRRDYYADHACPRCAFCAVSFETLGCFSLSTMQFLCRVTIAAFPRSWHQHATCIANVYCQLLVLQCRCPAGSRLLWASTLHAPVLAGFAKWPRLLRRCSTERLWPAASAAGFVSVELAPWLLSVQFCLLLGDCLEVGLLSRGLLYLHQPQFCQ